jgi:hypothetical protein
LSLYRAGLGSLLLPDKQVDRIDAMRVDSLNRLDETAKGVKHAVVAGAIISALSTVVLVRNAYKMQRAR